MIFSKNKKEDLSNLKELADLRSKINKVRLVKKLGKQVFQYDKNELFEPITKAITESNRPLH